MVTVVIDGRAHERVKSKGWRCRWILLREMRVTSSRSSTMRTRWPIWRSIDVRAPPPRR